MQFGRSGWVVWLSAGVLILHCGSDDAGTPEPVDARDGGAVGVDAPPILGFSDATTPTIKSLIVDPPTSTLTVTDLVGPAPTTALTAKATYADGTVGTVAASWMLDRYDIASVATSTAAGTVTASRSAYGKAKVTATVGTMTATADVTVALKASINIASAPAADIALLDGATAVDPSVAALVYPYDKTVFPVGLLAPELMWNGGATADLYRVHFAAPNFDLSVYTTAAPPSRFTPTQALWNALGATAKGAQANVELRRLAGGSAFVSAKQVWTIADANLRGAIYYWSIGQGQIVKLDVSTGQRSIAFSSGLNTDLGTPAPLNSGSPLTPPWDASNVNDRCVACHSVSKDGSRLAAVFSRKESRGPAGTVALSNQSITAVGDYGTNVQFTALTPSGSFVVTNSIGATIQLLDGTTAAPIASALDATSKKCHPVFSPDGKLFAVTADCDGPGPPVEFNKGSLELWDFDEATKAFSNARTIVTSAGSGDAVAYPSFAPDSAHVFFQRGNYSRAKYGNNLHGVDDLFVANAATGAAVALDAANGAGVLSGSNLHLNYAPTVNPIAEGGYNWVVFTSPRDYGNRMVATGADVTYENRKQLWVTAVDTTIGGTDPSHPAFWLPGQDAATPNMFGYWALSPCKPSAGVSPPPSCAAGFECCSGFCRDTGAGPVCVEAPTGCHQVGEKCTTSSDCCESTAVSCVAGICQRRIQ